MTAMKDCKTLGQKGVEGAVRFLERRGYEVLEVGWSCDAGGVDIIATDEDTLVFVDISTTLRLDGGKMRDSEEYLAEREMRELVAASYLETYEEVDISIRFDSIDVLVIGPDRALLRHHINAGGCAA